MLVVLDHLAYLKDMSNVERLRQDAGSGIRRH